MESPKKFIKIAMATLLFLVITSSFADPIRQADPFREIVTVDNEHFQSYKNRTGKWILAKDLHVSLESFMKQVGVTENEVKAINNSRGKISLNQPIFVPFSSEYTNKLLSEGKGRKIVFSDVRELLWPIGKDSDSSTRIYISSRVGRRGKSMHNGIDIACPMKSPILAASDGVVVSVGEGGKMGRHIVVQHSVNRIQTTYAHNTQNLVKKGDRVRKGQIIALAGSTGYSTGSHLHLEVRYNSVVLNPEHFFTPPGADYDSKVVMLEQIPEKFVK